jgi:hypothetical protein
VSDAFEVLPPLCPAFVTFTISLSVVTLQRGTDKGVGPIKVTRTRGTSKHTYFI